MDNLKRIGLYGVSGTGKTTILKEVSLLTSNVIWLEGSKLVINSAGLTLEQFKKLSDTDKYFYREKAIDKAFEFQTKERKHIIIDGHLVFAKGENEFENVMTEKDKTFYTDYIYLNFPTETIFQRQQNDRDKKRDHSARTISDWVAFELQELQQFCNNHKVNLHILQTTDTKECAEFICNYITT